MPKASASFIHKSILVVAAHPDDEVLGCGGTIARLANEGATVHILLLADGETSRFVSKVKQRGTGASAIAARNKAAELRWRSSAESRLKF